MANLDFSNFTAPNFAINWDDVKEAVRRLNMVLWRNFRDNEQLQNIVRIIPNQVNGKKVAILHGFGLVGEASDGCNMTYNDSLTVNSENVWDIQEWQVAESVCYETLKGTLAQEILRSHTDVADVTGTYIDDVLRPMLEQAIEEMLLRFAFFGDKNASEYDSINNTSGTLQPGTDPKFFNVIDGFWQQIFAGVSGNTITRTTISANAQTTIALQRSAMYTSGVASGLMDTILAEAPIELSQANDQVILVTKALWDAVRHDVKVNNIGSEMQFESWFGGIKKAEWDGVTVLCLPFMDKIITKFEQNNTNTGAYNMPYRAIYTVKDNLIVGTESRDSYYQLDSWFDKTDQKNYILAKDTIGAMVLDHSLIHVAY